MKKSVKQILWTGVAVVAVAGMAGAETLVEWGFNTGGSSADKLNAETVADGVSASALKMAPAQAASRLLSELGLHGSVDKAGEVRHAYSHFKLELMVFSVDVEPITNIAETNAHCWCCADELEKLPIHGAHKKAYNKLLSCR